MIKCVKCLQKSGLGETQKTVYFGSMTIVVDLNTSGPGVRGGDGGNQSLMGVLGFYWEVRKMEKDR